MQNIFSTTSDLKLKGIFTLIDEFNKLGFKLYLVGGAVRDLYLGKEITDYDLASDIDPISLAKHFTLKENKYRAKFYSYTIIYSGFSYELTLLRSDFKYTTNRSCTSVLTTNLRLDALRRDFTINALYYDSLLHDPLNGFRDLKRREIRFIGHVKKKVLEDPIRIIRALYFVIKLDFKISHYDFQYLKRYGYLLRKYNHLTTKYITKMKIINYSKTKQLLALINY